jgi:hypothetical protein
LQFQDNATNVRHDSDRVRLKELNVTRLQSSLGAQNYPKVLHEALQNQNERYARVLFLTLYFFADHQTKVRQVGRLVHPEVTARLARLLALLAEETVNVTVQIV